MYIDVFPVPEVSSKGHSRSWTT